MARRRRDPAGELADRMRELIDRSGLSLDAVAARTGRDRQDWEAYVRGRRRPPRDVTAALSVAVGAHKAPLLELWDRAELRARSEGTAPDSYPAIFLAGGALDDPAAQAIDAQAIDAQAPDDSAARRPSWAAEHAGERAAEHAGGRLDVAGPSGAPEAPAPHGSGRPRGPSRRERRPGHARTLTLVATAVGVALVVLAVVLLTGLGSGGPGQDESRTAAESPAAGAPSGAPSGAGRTQAAAESGGRSDAATGPGLPSAPRSTPPSASAPGAPSAPVTLPPGVGCAPGACAGRDPEAMGCASGRAATLATGTVGSAFVEVRYSATCAAAWARVTGSVSGGKLRITPGGAAVAARTAAGTVTYTAMIDAPKPHGLHACLTPTAGKEVCTPAR